MRLSTRSRYGLRLMLALALRYGKGSVFLKDIASSEDMSEKYLSQIMIPLKAKGLVVSLRGVNGGYLLARPPSTITLREIVELLEGGLGLVGCVGNPSICSKASACTARETWRFLSERIARTLDSLNLEDMVKSYNSKDQSPIMYNI